MDGLTLSLAIIKIENYIYFIEYFGAKIYNKILLELIKIISSKVLDGEEMFHTQQDEFWFCLQNLLVRNLFINFLCFV